MNKPRLLSGEEIVNKGATKAIVSLPEIGLKDVTPNGSWLEQKQIQSALDARKQLIEVERIEKWGTLSHAIWREDLMLAEVTKQTGGYWQYLGHHSGKVLYLNPEEALYLMEVNCLHLQFNDVTVSLQQAYSLLLRGQVSILQYKVYASLSRLGYKIFRFIEPKTGNETNLDTLEKVKVNVINNDNDKSKVNTEAKIVSDNSDEVIVNNKQNDFDLENATTDVKSDDVVFKESEVPHDENMEETAAENIIFEANDLAIVKDNEIQIMAQNESMETDSDKIVNCDENTPASNNVNNAINSNSHKETVHDSENTANTSLTNNAKNNKEVNKINSKIFFLQKRKLKSQSPKDIHKYFESIPELVQKETVTVIVPTEHLPDGVNPRYASYEINLNNVRTRNKSSSQSDTNTFAANDRTGYRVESTLSTQQSNNQYYNSHDRFIRQPFFNQFQFWRPRTNWNSFSYNIFTQRPFIRNTFFATRFQFFPRQFTNFRPRFHFFPRNFNYARPSNSSANTRPDNNTDFTTNNSSSSRKRTRDGEQILRLNTIKNLAANIKTKRLIRESINIGIVEFLQNLIRIYNGRYQTRIRLTDDFEIDDNENIVETITLDDDEIAVKIPRREESDSFEENFSSIQQMATKLKELEDKESATPQHRRALSKVVRTFNDSYNADININESYEVVDRRHIVLDSSSDSDCVIKEAEVKKDTKKVRKKVRNPFNLLKNLAEKSRQIACCSKEIEEIANEESENKEEKGYSEEMKRSFKSWLPKSDDFGRAEVVPKSLMLARIIEANKQTFLYDFVKTQICKFANWLDVKISFLENMEYAAALFNDEHVMENSPDWNSIIKPEDCKDMSSVLNKLSIISNNSDVNPETSLRIDFDVYNKDVKHFKKSNLPKPHFRIICIKQSSEFPPGPDVAALHARHGDVPIVFAIVGASVSYLQINPVKLPMYIAEEEST
ncbi:probable serine/threonine-protein kinase DDB_G0286465 isoform X1 [Amyelois transitella]|uniref:probable serine/threonine-protein kinase DDB_G0286465 isoform X1 n=2 Tax=Amyelois transitella TaxID=680683 RepID=UPI002990046A|nr:probable serine/threonine-protein kinase DDB_G0286465 isoform X1 [Amyelois transitella]